jgi:hypothetical protein
MLQQGAFSISITHRVQHNIVHANGKVLNHHFPMSYNHVHTTNFPILFIGTCEGGVALTVGQEFAIG